MRFSGLTMMTMMLIMTILIGFIHALLFNFIENVKATFCFNVVGVVRLRAWFSSAWYRMHGAITLVKTHSFLKAGVIVFIMHVERENIPSWSVFQC